MHKHTNEYTHKEHSVKCGSMILRWKPNGQVMVIALAVFCTFIGYNVRTQQILHTIFSLSISSLIRHFSPPPHFNYFFSHAVLVCSKIRIKFSTKFWCLSDTSLQKCNQFVNGKIWVSHDDNWTQRPVLYRKCPRRRPRPTRNTVFGRGDYMPYFVSEINIMDV